MATLLVVPIKVLLRVKEKAINYIRARCVNWDSLRQTRESVLYA